MHDSVTCWDGHKLCMLPEVSVLDGVGWGSVGGNCEEWWTPSVPTRWSCRVSWKVSAGGQWVFWCPHLLHLNTAWQPQYFWWRIQNVFWWNVILWWLFVPFKKNRKIIFKVTCHNFLECEVIFRSDWHWSFSSRCFKAHTLFTHSMNHPWKQQTGDTSGKSHSSHV